MKKCLVIDDVEVTRYVTEEILRRAGFDCIAANDSEQALKLLRKHTYDVVFLDWHIGKESGIELLKKIRIEFPRSLPVVVFSGVEKQEASPEAMKAGASSFLEKPTTKEKLEQCLKGLKLL